VVVWASAEWESCEVGLVQVAVELGTPFAGMEFQQADALAVR